MQEIIQILTRFIIILIVMEDKVINLNPNYSIKMQKNSIVKQKQKEIL